MTADRLRLEAHTPDFAPRWDAFVRASKNGALLFERGFMDYHADRFEDASLVAFQGPGRDNPVALLPACRLRADGEDQVVSHAGLTFGGWITDGRMTAAWMLRLFEMLRERLADEGVSRLRYKAAPSCYHREPAEEDLYALFRCGARLVRSDLGSVVDLGRPANWSKSKRQGLTKARAAGVTVARSGDLAAFHALLAEVLARHGAQPTHSVAELRLLAGRFPDRIALFAAHAPDATPLAYVLVFDSGETVHTQYMASNAEGRTCGALDAIVAHLQHVAYADRRRLSFGISTEDGGRRLNEGLAAQKEMFGARAVVFPCYELEIPPR
ncbi:GNAT family N-acetyltransferase [Phenylobacterium sp.]|uniref:GNAT family N-acetyltransferase n=1 Tax=Phenylobacterium sp. TaxID=1871053 RepID=UPI0025D979FD|nr:GNAT family N-acetyltransferase [Phenylobacterium sp.]MBX3482843.1 GNAT family N-acetyltransferase [Phenylobacterium sp.]MCW5758300.1 GNAT family N-acetyltransferase [Phenylobacterium sp.]